MARASSVNPAIRLASAADWPLVATLEPAGLWSSGIGNLVIARRAPSGRLVVGVYLVDVYCLGVKNVLWNELGEAEYKGLLNKLSVNGGPLRPIAAERFAKLVYCAADYAQSLGIPPHPEFRAVRHLMDGIDPSLCADEFEFGQDGKPFYMAGPHDSPGFARMVANRIEFAGGHYMIPLTGSMRLAFDDEDT